MDEREIHDQLAGAAETIAPTSDLATRAESRYLRRRTRVRVVGAAVVIALIASGVTTAAIVSRKTTNTIRPAVAPTTTNPSAVPRTTIANGASGVDFNQLNNLSFVDAMTGFGLLQDSDSQTGIIRSDDGGRSWRRVGTLDTFEQFVHFENHSDGVAWGTGPLELTTDGGVHWRAVDGPVDNQLAWSDGRLWAMTPCVQSTPCGSRPVLTSDDAGRIWQPTAPLQQGLGPAYLIAGSRSNAYVAEPASDAQSVTAWQLALTHDGGASWTYRSVPCPSFTVSPSLAFNGTTLLLLCEGEPAGTTGMSQLLASTDDGRTWVPRCQCLGDAGVSSVGSTFLADFGRGGIESSTDDGRTWHSPAFVVGDTASLSASVPGVGIWLYIVRSTSNGIWFSADGVHWEQRLQLTPTGRAVTAGPTTTNSAAGPLVDPGSISSLSFVDARTGFGLAHAPGVSMQSMVRTDDGGRTWHVVSTLQTANWFVHFENASDGVVWGDGTLHVTTDGGAHWRIPAGAPVDDLLAWSGGRIWALSCVNHRVCATRVPSVSDDGGSTWRSIAPPGQSLNAGPIIATSQSDAYALEPAAGRRWVL